MLNTNTLVTVQVSAALSTQTEFASQWIPVDGQGTAQARHETGGVVIDGKIYMIGGRGHKHIDIYDLESNRWTRTIKTPIEMHHFQPVAIGTKIYLLGGMTCCYPQEKSIEHVQIFDTRTRKWSEGAKIPAKRRRGGAGAAVYKDKIYLLGGNTKGHSGGAVNWFDEFDPQTGKWKALKNAPDARDHANIAIIGSKLVAAGGRKSAHPNTFANTVRQTNVYDFETGNWQRAAAIPTQRAGTMTVAVGSEVIVLGGESIRQRTAHREVEAFDVNTGKWRTLTPLSIARHSGVAVVSGDYIHVVAGAVSIGGRNETNQHEKLKFR
ncbi:hypothetical protein AB833_09075 [Chromatiales bacterium (ex Bugula neritina AB1)]|nr:hypothetical protein AB833_09075 [Chromatiales bacterium (ex Bugula neritina AB1)]